MKKNCRRSAKRNEARTVGSFDLFQFYFTMCDGLKTVLRSHKMAVNRTKVKGYEHLRTSGVISSTAAAETYAATGDRW